ncbi:60S ribosomal protein L21-1 [Morella rubra]|uniref:60S ribosomal protein L21-1 n=1 Tax=Morella rubra TaxID=262757 RepID=A0A6A1UU95_9ROSI|nr:60S ribosomal protein L21-1 [Morella rubra]
MPPGHGLRSRIRGLFGRPYRNSAVHEGMPHKSSRSHKIGDYVDIKVNGSPGEGMPHELYHGRTGRVWKVTKRAIGVEVNDQKWWYRFNASSSTRLLYPRADLEQTNLKSRYFSQLDSTEPSLISHQRGDVRAKKRKSEMVWHGRPVGSPANWTMISSVVNRAPVKNRVVVPGS